MTDPLRSGRPPASPEATDREREARVEELLLTGLDHYFSGHHDLAVNVWTRVLFLDRGHARARAYIERARSAIAERQREGEELLHSGMAAFQRGDQAAARALIKSAIDRGAGGEEAMALLQRLDRLVPAEQPGAEIRPSLRAARDLVVATAEPPGRSQVGWVVVGVIAGIVVGGVALVSMGERGQEWLGLRTAARPQPATRAEEPLPVPAASELSLARARGLRSRGHLREALTALDSIGYGDRFRAEADELRSSIQQELLAAGRGTTQSTLRR